jgi:hypothetical protein
MIERVNPMRLQRVLLPGVLVGLCVLGCGSHGPFNAKGRVLKGGKPFELGENEGLRIFFVPLDPPAGGYDSFAAEFHKDGTFVVKGKDGRGLPPGKYRVTLQHMKNKEDLFRGRFMGEHSPFTCEVGRGSGEVVVDLDKSEELSSTSE